MRRSVRGEYQIGGPTLCASAPSHRSHAMPPRRTRNSDRLRASDRTMVATKSNRLPSFKSRRTLSLLENEPRERKSNPEKNLSSDREPSAHSGLDIETKNLSATGRGRTFFVDIPFYRTTYLSMRRPSGAIVSEAGAATDSPRRHPWRWRSIQQAFRPELRLSRSSCLRG